MVLANNCIFCEQLVECFRALVETRRQEVLSHYRERVKYYENKVREAEADLATAQALSTPRRGCRSRETAIVSPSTSAWHT
ncbi:MAG: hypothetical protein C4521_07640 [Actinobacteria bacterium]|nr:MAG: hypothetical protein C4521_07640 [Actinomycetota bacterium]